MNEKFPKVIIAGGSTGGHIYPGICLAKELRTKGYEISFLVKDNEHITHLLDLESLKYHKLDIIGLPRKISFKLVSFFVKLLVSFVSTYKIVREIQPKFVVGLGGYTSFPLVCVAKLLRIPNLIHEQNYLPGLTNKLLSVITNKICISFPESKEYFQKSKTIFTGNPVRKELLNINKKSVVKEWELKETRFTVLIFGGSQGANSINKLLVDSLEFLSEYRNKIQFIHLTGKKDFTLINKFYGDENFGAKVFPYLYNMGKAYSVADLIISRAGATTIAELMMLKKPAVLIPFPYATGRHQDCNAKYLVDRNTAVMYNQSAISAEKMANVLIDFIDHPEKLTEMGNSYKNISSSNSTQLLVNAVTSFVKGA